MLSAAFAFAPLSLSTTKSQSHLIHQSTSTSTAESVAREALISTAQRLKSQYGVFIIDKNAKDELQSAVSRLENLSRPPGVLDDNLVDQMTGDWTLVSTTSAQQGFDTSLLPNPFEVLRQSITEASNKYVTVIQRIRSTSDGVSNAGFKRIDRIDHVLQYQPPTQLSEVLNIVPPQLSSININPLDVSQTSLCLIHKAEITSQTPLITRLALTSIVLNVAGQSTMLSPQGADVAGINLPFGEFINTGDFETTYIDDNLRISRGKQGFVDQLRVFLRTDKRERRETVDAWDQTWASEADSGTGVTAQVDVDEVADPEFVQPVTKQQDIADEDV
jgi:PAP_fibrillin